MLRKISFALLWLSLIVYAFVFAPPPQPGTWELIKQLSAGGWTTINPIIVALFNLMGILPLIYASLLLIDGGGQKLKAWPFVVGSFGVGAFAILPYLALREPNPNLAGKKGLLIRILDSRWLGLILTLGAVSLCLWGIVQGDWGDFVRQWQTSRFIHVMSLDFCLLCLLFPTLIGDDLARRKVTNLLPFWAFAFIPFVGALLYLCLRPPLAATEEVNVPSLTEV